MSQKFAHKKFPNSYIDPFILTSPQTGSYNCIAWAFGDNTKWYWPDPNDMFFWPNNISRTVTIESFIDLYKLIGYEVCENGDFIEELEKITIFTDSNNIPTHAARQLPNGFWTSKLGQSFDVSHSIPSMNGSTYGNATIFMSRKRQ